MGKQFKYIIVAERILEEICPSLSLGELLPPADELCAKYSVSIITINKALSLLVEKGIVKRTPHKGTELIQKAGNVSQGIPEKKRTIKVAAINDSYFADYIEKLLVEYCKTNRKAGYEINRLSLNDYNRIVKEGDIDLILTGIWKSREFITTPGLRNRFIPLKDIEGLWFNEELYPEEIIKWCSDNESSCMALPFGYSTVLNRINCKYPGGGVKKLDGQLTFEEFANVLSDTAKKLESNEYATYPFYIRFTYNGWSVLIRRFGGRIISDDGAECLLNTPETMAAIHKVLELVYQRKVCLPLGMSMGGTGIPNLFDTGKFLCTWQGSRERAQVAFTSKYTPLPGDDRGTNPIVIDSLMVHESGKQRELTVDFLNFSQMHHHQKSFFDFSGLIPAQKDIAEECLRNDDLSVGFRQFMDLTNVEPVMVAARTDILPHLQKEMCPLWLNLDPVDKICNKIAKEVNEMLKTG